MVRVRHRCRSLLFGLNGSTRLLSDQTAGNNNGIMGGESLTSSVEASGNIALLRFHVSANAVMSLATDSCVERLATGTGKRQSVRPLLVRIGGR